MIIIKIPNNITTRTYDNILTLIKVETNSSSSKEKIEK